MPEPQQQSQIQGLPPGAVVGPTIGAKPVGAGVPPTSTIEGLPPGAVVGAPVGGAQAAAAGQDSGPGGETHQTFVQKLGDWLQKADEFTKKWIAVPAVDIQTGAIKRAGKTLYGAASLINKAIPEKIAPAMPPADQALQIMTGNPGATFEPQGAGEKVGAVGEQAMEWIGGEAVVKGLLELSALSKIPSVMGALKQYPRAARMIQSLGRMGKAAAAGAGIGTLEGAAEGKTGEGAISGAETGAVAGFASEVIGGLAKAAKNAIMSSKPAIDAKALTGIKDIADRVVSTLPEGASGTKFGETVISRVRDVRAQLGKEFNDIEKEIAETPVAEAAAGERSMKISGSLIPKSEVESLGKQAQNFIKEEFSVPAGREAVAGLGSGEKRVVDLMKDISDVNKPLSIEDAISLRQRMFSAAEGEGLTASQRGAAMKFAGILGDKIQGALEAVAPKDLVQRYSALRASYKKFQDTLNEGVLSNLFTKDAKSGLIKLARDPEEVGSYLWNKSSPTTAAEIKTLVGPNNFQMVQKGILQYMTQSAAEAELAGKPVAQELIRVWNKAGAEGQAAYFGGPLKNQLDGLMRDIAKKPNRFGAVMFHGTKVFLYVPHAGIVLRPDSLAEIMSSAYKVQLLRNLINSPKAAIGLHAAKILGAAYATSGPVSEEGPEIKPEQ